MFFAQKTLKLLAKPPKIQAINSRFYSFLTNNTHSAVSKELPRETTVALPILNYYKTKKSAGNSYLHIAALATAAALAGIGHNYAYSDQSEETQEKSDEFLPKITYLEYAKLASAAYHSDPQQAKDIAPEGWTRVYHDYREANWGFGAALYSKDGNYVIVVRGTESLWDLVKDVALIFRQNPADQADVFFRKALNYINNNSIKNSDVTNIKTLSGKDEIAAKELEKILATLNKPGSSGLSLAQVLVLSLAIPLSGAVVGSGINIVAPGYGALGATAASGIGYYTLVSHLLKQFNTSLSEKAEYLTDCFKAIDAISKQHVTATGHSLGATMVEICAIEFNIKCVTFESPGCAEILQKTHLTDPNKMYSNVTGFLAAPNSINTLYSHVGNNYRLKIPHSALAGTSFLNGASGTTSRTALWSGLLLAVASPFTGGATLAPAGYALATAAGAKTVEVSSGAIRNMSWALEQHYLKNTIKALEQLPNAASATRFHVICWPSFWQHNFGARAARGLTGLLPFYSTNRTLFNFNDNQQVDEAQIENTPGYIVKDSFSRPKL